MSADERDSSETRQMAPDVKAANSDVRPPRRRFLLFVYHRDGVASALLEPGIEVVVGREPPADVVVRDHSLSRRHASFKLVEGAVKVHDLSSRNGTWLGGAQVTEVDALPGDEITLGAVVACVQVQASADVPSFGFDGHDAFLAALDAEIVRARHFQRTFAVLMVRAQSQQEAHLRRWWPTVREVLAPIDRIGLYGRDEVELVRPEATREQAHELARRLIARREDTPPLVCGVAMFPELGATPEELVDASRNAARCATSADPIKDAEPRGARVWSPKGGEGASDDGFIAASPVMRGLFEKAKRIAGASTPVLLLGETGAGKEVLAKMIHRSSPRAGKDMVCVNCGAIPAHLIESTLFGHRRGAFTHAVSNQVGVFEAADGSTVLLDEIGDLPPPAQVALLRIIEDKLVTPVGATRPSKVDVRVIAATHRDLEAMCEAGTFRSDLFERLSVIVLKIAPLRAHREDIPLLARRFLREANDDNGRRIQIIEPAAMALLEGYAWPGNIRQLRFALHHAVANATGDTLTIDDLPERVRRRAAEAPATPATDEPTAGAVQQLAGSWDEQFRQFETSVIVEALRATRGNQVAAAKRLGISVRTVQEKVKKLGIKKRYDPED